MNEKRTDTYYCDRHEEIVQIAVAPGISPRCPVCAAVMTFGRYTEKEPVRTLEEACAYLLWSGKPVQLDRQVSYAVRAYLDCEQPYGVQYDWALPDNRALVVLFPRSNQ